MNGKILSAVICGVFLTPVCVDAHNIIKGGGDFLNGVLHPFFSLSHLLVVVALGILAGKQNEKAGSAIFWWYLGSLVISLGLAAFSIGFSTETYLLSGAGILGLLLVTDRTLPTSIWALLSVCMGLFAGLDFVEEPGKMNVALNTGTGLTLYFCFLYATVFGESFNKKGWQRIGVRVLGSWITAISALDLSLKLFVKNQ
jgi:urease accessory protein